MSDMRLIRAVGALLTFGESNGSRRLTGERSTEASVLASPVLPLDGLRAGVTADVRDGMTTRSEDPPEISDGVEERIALAVLFGIACGIPLFSRWRSHGRG